MLKFGPILLRITLLCNFVAFGAVLSSTVAFGESLLPPCPTNEMAFWTDCQGTYTHPDGEEYVGEFRDGKPNGQGTHTYSDGRKYIGEWRNGNFNGQGIFTYTHWGEYVGEFRDSKPHGRGTYTYPDGRKYVGEWRNGSFNGQGTLTYPDGRKEVGEFRDNKYVGGSLVSIVNNTPSLASRSAENGLSLLIPMVLLVVGSAVAALFVMRAKPQTSLALSTPASTHAATQSKLDDTRRALREAAIDFSVPDDKLLELRRAFAELDRKAAKKDLFGLLKFW